MMDVRTAVVESTVGASSASTVSLLEECADAESHLRICPNCGGEGTLRRNGFFRLKCGRKKQRYRCAACNRTCNLDTGTPIANLKRRAEWARMVVQMDRPRSLRSLAAELSVHLSTAFRWRHRWLDALCRQEQPPLKGQVSVAAVSVPYSEKGSRTCRGPGSWGFWNWLRRGPRPGDGDRFRFDRNRFRLLADGRPSTVLLAQNAVRHVSVVLGQKPGVERYEWGLKQLVSRDAEVYGNGQSQKPAFTQACQRLNRPLLRQEGASRAADMPVIPKPEHPVGWLTQFRGVATKYLDHYMAWFSHEITLLLRAVPC